MSNPSRRKPKPSSDEPDKQLEPEMLSGRRWGFSEPGASIGFEREVRVDVLEDRFIIAERITVPIAKDESKQEMFEQFATSLDRYSHEWGRPPQGFSGPRLNFIVKPEASMHYEQLNSMMTRAGISSSREFTRTLRRSNLVANRWLPQSRSRRRPEILAWEVIDEPSSTAR